MRWRDGAPTLTQVCELYRLAQLELHQESKFQAALQGVDLESDSPSTSSVPKKKNELAFRDPSEYVSMTDEEKEELTKKMMSAHSQIMF